MTDERFGVVFLFRGPIGFSERFVFIGLPRSGGERDAVPSVCWIELEEGLGFGVGMVVVMVEGGEQDMSGFGLALLGSLGVKGVERVVFSVVHFLKKKLNIGAGTIKYNLFYFGE